MKMNKNDKERLQHDLIAMADSYPENLIDRLCQVIVDYDKPTLITDDTLIEGRRFDDSYNVINPILLYLMSCDYAITGLELDKESKAYNVELYIIDDSNNAATAPDSPYRRYAIIQIESEGATLYIYERPIK